MERPLTIPVYKDDFWSDEVILDPYPVYDNLRRLGPVVWMERHSAYALTSYNAVRHALTSPEIFSSSSGCMMNEPMNEATKGIMLCSDGKEHLAMRRLFAKPLTPKALTDLTPRLRTLAAERVDELLKRGSFDAVEELAHLLPMALIVELMGLDQEGREKMLGWASSIFDAFGPIESARTLAGVEVATQVVEYVLGRLDRSNLIPGGWGETLFLAADQGQISEQTARLMLIDYIGPSLDTTIHAVSSAIELFGNHPEEWAKLRSDRSLVSSAIDEVLRLETPIRAFSRLVATDHEIDGHMLKAGARALVLYACANRDEKKYADPNRFDITRKASDHLAFGAGPHVCAGLYLAKLEMASIFNALADRVETIKVGSPIRTPHNTLRGLDRLETELLAA
jgi:cytochrome P450